MYIDFGVRGSLVRGYGVRQARASLGPICGRLGRFWNRRWGAELIDDATTQDLCLCWACFMLTF